MADEKSKAGQAGPGGNVGNAPGGEKLSGGAPPTGDKAPESVQEAQKDLEQYPPYDGSPEFNPTTPDGSPPPNNLPGPHGPQGVEHLQADPAADVKKD